MLDGTVCSNDATAAIVMQILKALVILNGYKGIMKRKKGETVQHIS
jgi:hypothetical protein